jgi:bacterioferritin
MKDAQRKQQIIEGLTKAYWMELETSINYLANSTNLDGILAEEVKASLAADVQGELAHAQMLAARIKELEGCVPGSAAFRATQDSLQPPEDTTDVPTVIRGVIEAEEAASAQYRAVIALAEGNDWVTQDLCIRLLTDEEGHLRVFRGFLKEYDKRDAAARGAGRRR